MSFKQTKKPFQKFTSGAGRKPFNKFKKGGGNRNQRFFQNARGFGKKGNFGRGTHIEEEEFTYFMGILEVQQHTPVGSWEEKVAMANNVMEQTKSKEIHFSSNQVVSKVLESLLGFVDAEHLERYFEVFGEELRPVCSHIYSSHILQKLMETAFVRAVGVTEEEIASIKAKRSRDIVTELKYNTTCEFAVEHRIKCSEFVVRISKFLLNNLEEFVLDSNACHLLRAAILTLAGVHIPKIVLQKGKAINNAEKFNGLPYFHRVGEFKLDRTIFKVPKEWSEILVEFPERLQMWPQFKEFPYNNKTSVLLQVICIALYTADTKALDTFGKKLINDTFMDVEIPKTPLKNQFVKNEDEGDEAKNGDEESANGNGVDEAKMETNEEEKPNAELKEEEEEDDEEKEVEEEDDDDKEKPSVLKTDSSIRLLQTLIAVASPKLLTQIHALFEGRMLSLVNNKFGIFAVQRFINYVVEKSQFEAILEEFAPHFEKFFQTNKASLVASLSATCLRLKTKQAAFITALQNTLHCTPSQGEDRPKAFFACLIKLKPFEVLPYDHKTYIGLFGSLIVQDILQFNKPIFLVNSILETPVKSLVEIFQCPNGSYIADKFFSSPSIGEKSREKFVKLFEGFYMDLALSQSGSRVIEQFMKVSSDVQKVSIAKELTGKENRLKGSPYGRILYNALKLETFKLSQEQWKASFNKKEAEPEEEVKEVVKAVEAMEVTKEAEDTEPAKAVETTASLPKNDKKNKKNKKRPAS